MKPHYDFMILAGIIPPHKLAAWIMDLIHHIMHFFGVKESPVPEEVLYLIAIIVLASAAGWLVKRLILVIINKIIAVRWPDMASIFQKYHTMSKCVTIIPPLVLLAMIPFAFDSDQKETTIILDASLIYCVITLAIAICAIVEFAWIQYDTHRNTKNLPLKGIADVIKGATWIVATIVIISIIVDKSPASLLTGLGAFAAVLLLIFRNSILGLVAGVQLSTNDMVRVGDWIQIPGTDTNGLVMDVSLVVVKVRNWNNTVSMVPTSDLNSKYFVNWRCMKDTGSRQVLMSVYIDTSTVRPLSDDELHTIQQKVPLISKFIDVKLKQRAEGHTYNVFNTEAGVNGTIDTNMGLLRAYVNIYVENHPYVNLERKRMTRILQPTPQGFPLQVFAYLTTADWAAYESIMADMFEHITAIAPTFGLTVYQQPSTRSVYAVGTNPKEGAPYYGTDPITIATPKPETNHMPDDEHAEHKGYPV